MTYYNVFHATMSYLA